VRCRSCVKSRRSCTPMSIRPDWRALPTRDTSSTPKNSGKIVTMSMRTIDTLLGGRRLVGGRRVVCDGLVVG
jgi:hypothetical protein